MARHTVWRHLLELRTTSGTTVLLTTHDMEEADYLCDRIAIMHQGRIDTLSQQSFTFGGYSTLTHRGMHTQPQKLNDQDHLHLELPRWD